MTIGFISMTVGFKLIRPLFSSPMEVFIGDVVLYCGSFIFHEIIQPCITIIKPQSFCLTIKKVKK